MKKRRRLQESLFAKLFFSLLFVLLAAGAGWGGILFLRSARQDGAQRGDIQSEAMERCAAERRAGGC